MSTEFHARRSAALILRVWLEHEGPDGFRARIVATLDLDDRQEATYAAATRDDALALVNAWLDAFLDDAPMP